MLSGLPFLELIALAWDAWASGVTHGLAALHAEPCGVAWCVVWLLRLLHVCTINLCLLQLQPNSSQAFPLTDSLTHKLTYSHTTTNVPLTY